MKLDEIVLEALKLSEEERASLASQLLHGLQTPVYEVSDDEVRKRMREADADPSALITFEELHERNYARWPTLGRHVHPNHYVGKSYRDEVEYLKQWIVGRLAWIDLLHAGWL